MLLKVHFYLLHCHGQLYRYCLCLTVTTVTTNYHEGEVRLYGCKFKHVLSPFNYFAGAHITPMNLLQELTLN